MLGVFALPFTHCLCSVTADRIGHTAPSKPLPVSPASPLALLPSQHTRNDGSSTNTLLLPCLWPWWCCPVTHNLPPHTQLRPLRAPSLNGLLHTPHFHPILVMVFDISTSEFPEGWSHSFSPFIFFSHCPAPRRCSVYICWIRQSKEARIKTWKFLHYLCVMGITT